MNRPELTAVNHYDVFPFNHGGSLGIRGLYKALSEWFDINIITFVTTDYYPDEVAISNHIKVIPIKLSEKLKDFRKEICKKYKLNQDSVIAFDLATVTKYHKVPELVERVRRIAENSLVVLAEHVYTWRVIKAACPDKHLWYRANNVEYDYKLKWSQFVYPKKYLQAIYDIEKECCEECERILAVSQLDIDRFMELYKYSEDIRGKFIDIRSGYDIDNLKTILPSCRKKISSKYSNTGFFITSYSSYGQVAAQNCIMIAKKLPDIQIIIAGNIQRAFRDVQLPDNIIFTGIISDKEKIYYLQHCDFALNLLEDGAGINVKMFEYFAYGIPVITTVHGARGILMIAGQNCVLTEKEHYIDDIREFCNMTLQERDRIAENALELLKKEYSWRSLGNRVAREIEDMYGLSIVENALPLEEIALYRFDEKEAYLPKKPFYIRCAGEYGKNCLSFMRSKGKEPQAFIDKNYSDLEKTVEGIPVISFDEFLNEKLDCEVIIAVSQLYMIDITSELIALGVPLEDILLSWDISGKKIMRLADFKGCVPQYYSADKWRDHILGKTCNRK